MLTLRMLRLRFEHKLFTQNQFSSMICLFVRLLVESFFLTIPTRIL